MLGKWAVDAGGSGKGGRDGTWSYKGSNLFFLTGPWGSAGVYLHIEGGWTGVSGRSDLRDNHFILAHALRV